jgi:LmbE family N-acetylglucosaminyl deacetylase
MVRHHVLIIFILLVFLVAQAQVSRPRDAAEIKIALKRLTVLGSVLYIAAHPDDENTALLAAMAQGRCYRTAYLSCTRGEGGQNLLGPEQGDMLGLIRTQELLAARRIDGAEQYFTRAIDFGYSKTSEETLRFWGREKTLSDVVWIIRKFRPDVIITRFTPSLGGHGNHTASALLAEEAFRAAGDSTRFPEQLRFVTPWQAKRIVWNVFRFSPSDTTWKRFPSVSFDLGAYSPLLGRSFTEIAGEGRSMHKSQGFGAALNRGEFINDFQALDGDTAKNDLFDGINTSWSRVQGSDSIQTILHEAYVNFDYENPAKSIPLLFRAYNQMLTLPESPWTILKKQELTQAILACAGVWIDAATSDNFFVPGGEVKFTAAVTNRSAYSFTLDHLKLPLNGPDTLVHSTLENNKTVRLNLAVHIPEHISYTQPYWLVEKPNVGSYTISDQMLVGKAENETPMFITVHLTSMDGTLDVSVPLYQKIVDPVEGESMLPIVIVPAVSINLQEPVFVFPDQSKKTITITLKAAMQNVAGIVRLKVPEFWQSSPLQQKIELKNKGDDYTLSFSVQPRKGAKSGKFFAEVEFGQIILNQGMQTAHYRHIPPQTLLQKAEGRLLKINLSRKEKTVGYIMGAGDDVPAGISQLGYSVTLLSDEDLAHANLDTYDVIVAGIRAYNTRTKLRIHQNRMMEYVEHGGTYIVQYVTPQKGEAENLGPYPFNVARDRVSEEDATITFVHQDDPILTGPNVITDQDFENWVQERGLYFADRWDTKYDTVIACHDQNEPDRKGGLLVAKYGKGWYVYCAYSFFRQLPAGVEGAYRLFANILSLGNNHLKTFRALHQK